MIPPIIWVFFIFSVHMVSIQNTLSLKQLQYPPQTNKVPCSSLLSPLLSFFIIEVKNKKQEKVDYSPLKAVW